MTFDPIFVPDELREAVSDRAWLQAMLDFERALAIAQEHAGLIPDAAAAAIVDACAASRDSIDLEPLVERARSTGNPAEPLVSALRARVGSDTANFVHFGATSQDVMDTAAAIVSRRASFLLFEHLDGVARNCAKFAREHRSTVMAGRTLLQQAVPTTFGLKSAGWLVAVLEARERLRSCVAALEVELGGAGGTLAALGSRGLEVLRMLAEELDLAEPVVPWHTNRVRLAEFGSALDISAGVLAKIAVDVALLAQTEVAEVREPPGSGGSSTMPHKRNPVGSALAVSCAKHAHGAACILTGSLAQEHERGLGGWQAEWGALSHAIAYTGAAAEHVDRVLEKLEVDAERMRANLSELTSAEHASFVLAERLGRERAHEVVAEAARASSFADGLRAAGLTEDQVERVLDPGSYLGAAEALVDRALALYDASP